jgi:oligoendopeptidase F
MQVNMTKAKEIAHDKRRAARSEEFKPWDLKATIPAEANKAEAERQKIRDKYAVLQTQMDQATTVEQLAGLMPKV